MTTNSNASRREFMRDASGFACAPLFLPGLKWQDVERQRPRNLVLVELFGGLDSLSLLVPRDDDDYVRARPTLAIPGGDLLRLDDDRGFPPNVAPLYELWSEGLVRIVESVGYPNSPLSHFTAREIWGAAMPNHTSVVNGWVARMRQQLWAADTRPEVITHVGTVAPHALRAPNMPVLCFEHPRDMAWMAPCGNASQRGMAKNKDSANGGDKRTDILSRLRGTLSTTSRIGPRIQELTRSYKPATPFPYSKFGSHLRTVSALIQGGFGSRVYSLSHGDFDMHTSDPRNTTQPQMEFAEGMRALMRNLKGTSAYEETLVLCYSEFGRRPKENSGGGCDHGAAGTMLLFGGNLNGGLTGTPPSMERLDENGNFIPSLDFRSVYAAVIEQWFQADHEPIMLEKLPVPTLI